MSDLQIIQNKEETKEKKKERKISCGRNWDLKIGAFVEGFLNIDWRKSDIEEEYDGETEEKTLYKNTK